MSGYKREQFIGRKKTFVLPDPEGKPARHQFTSSAYVPNNGAELLRFLAGQKDLQAKDRTKVTVKQTADDAEGIDIGLRDSGAIDPVAVASVLETYLELRRKGLSQEDAFAQMKDIDLPKQAAPTAAILEALNGTTTETKTAENTPENVPVNRIADVPNGKPKKVSSAK